MKRLIIFFGVVFVFFTSWIVIPSLPGGIYSGTCCIPTFNSFQDSWVQIARIVSGEVRASSARADSRVGADNIDSAGENKTILFFDFEDGSVKGWHHLGVCGTSPFLMQIDGHVERNTSKRVLHIKVLENKPSGSMTFDFNRNGIEPVVLTPDIHIAWCWNVSRVIGTNGLWLYVNLKDKRSKNIIVARAVNYVKYMHDYMSVYHDPPLCWKYHSEPIYDYVWRRFGPFANGDIVIESITFGISHGSGLEAWIDNIWLGRGDPPDSINVIEENESSTMEVESKLTSFSYGFIDHDNIPDRIDVYRERADIFINPHMNKDRRSSLTGNIDYIKMEPDYVINFKKQRGDGVVTLADLDGDGHDDFLFHFDDLAGSLCYKNGYLRGEFNDVTHKIGALACGGEHGAGSAMADIDRDGDLDLFMFNAFTRHGFFGGVRFFRNEDGFSFVKWTEESRILSEGSFGGAFGDFNGDSDEDIFINYRPLDSGGRPLISFNDGGGRFHPSEEALRAPADIHFCSSTVADFDNDADLDIYCVSDWIAARDEIPLNMFFRNNGKGFFEDMTDISRTGYAERTNAALSGDFDQDGLVDIYLINSESPCVFYHNTGSNVFEKSSAFKDFFCKIPVTNGAAVDIDRDGDLDIVMLRRDRAGLIIRKNRGDKRNFLQVRLRARGKNKVGIGGKVYIYQANFAGQKDHLIGYREIRSANGSFVFSPPIAHFGLGEHESVDVLAIFPSAGNSPPDTVIKRNVPSGTFLTVCERGGLSGCIFCNPRVDYMVSSFERALFSQPVSIFFLLVFVIISGAGILIKNSARPWLFNTAKVLLILLIVFVSGAALIRSFEWSVLVLICSGLIVIFSYQVEEILRRSVTSRAWRDKMEEMLLDDLSQAIHTEKKFAFLADFARSANKIPNLNPEEIDEDFKNMDKMVSLMRICSASDPTWRAVRAGVNNIRKLCDDMTRKITSKANKGINSDSVEVISFRHALDRLNSELVDYRLKLRLKRSVSFARAWKELEREYAAKLGNSGIELELDFPDGIEKYRVHLLHDEFRHIFKNLLDNSIWAVKESKKKKISLTCYFEANYLVAHWRDTGAGIPENLRDLLFSAPVESSRPGGTGEGCYISRKILRRRNGLIRAEKTYTGVGTGFIVKMIKLN